MFRRQLARPAQLATIGLCGGASSSGNGVSSNSSMMPYPQAPSRRHFYKPSTPLSFVYAPPGSGGRDGPGMPWHLSRGNNNNNNSNSSANKAQPPHRTAASGSATNTTTAQVDTSGRLEDILAGQLHQHPAQVVQKATTTDSTTTTTATAATSSASPVVSPVAPQVHHAQRNNNNNNTTTTSTSMGTANGSNGALKATQTRRMSALSGPSLDTRIEDIIRVEQDLSAETLPKVVELLIDNNAEGVERITLSEFAAMQPRRQLVALGGKKQWLEFLLNSPYYAQVSRLAAESPSHDLRALQQAGITTLHQWTENQNLVKVSARTKSALDAAVEQSVRMYMNEVAQLVNTSNQLSPLLCHWVSDVVGKFVLDSLKISVESASAALWRRRGGAQQQDDKNNNNSNSSGFSSSGDGGAAALSAMLEDAADGGRQQGKGGNNNNTAGGGKATGPVLRPGEACTLEHYHHFCQKVLSSVRQDAKNSGIALGATDYHAEAEITARAHNVIATALTQLLEQAVKHHLPPELAPLYNNGYIAMDRMPALLRRAVSFLQLRTVPVRYFVFHSTANSSATSAVNGGGGNNNNHHHASSSLSSGVSAAESAAAMSSKLNVPSPSFGPGTFLTGSDKADVTLGAWSGTPEPPSSTNEHDPAEAEYLSVLRRLRKHLDKLSMTPLFDVIDNAEAYGAQGFEAFEAIGLDQLFGHAKLVEDRLAALLNYPPATSEKPLHFIEAGYTSGKTALLERLAQRTRAGERAAVVRYGGTSTPFVPDLDDHPIAFPARFWLRVALACCPFLVRTEELYSRAPRSVMWWGNEKNWSWDAFQNLIACANHVGSHRGAAGGGSLGSQPQLTTILVDDMDRVLDSMEAKWAIRGAVVPPGTVPGTTALAHGGSTHAGVSTATGAGVGRTSDTDLFDEDDDEGEPSAVEGKRKETKAKKESADADDNNNNNNKGKSKAAKSPEEVAAAEKRRRERKALAALTEAEERQKAVSVWLTTGKTIPELLAASFAKITVALGQVDCVFTGQRLSPILQHHAHVPVRRYFTSGVERGGAAAAPA